MSFELRHTFVSKSLKPSRQTSGEQAFFKVDERGDFQVLFPGRLNRGAAASFTHKLKVDDVGPEPLPGEPPHPGSTPLHGGFESVTKRIPLKLRVFTPDKREFTASEITLADLRKFRDLRGRPVGLWSYTVTGESERILVDEGSIITNAKGTVSLGTTEAVASESAPPLVNNAPITSAQLSFQFDLFRVGTFTAEISQPATGAQWRGSMQLLDPDGGVVAQTTGRKLTFAVGLPTLNKSRDAAGNVRKWTLKLSPQGGGVAGSPRVSATVIGTGRITIASLRERIDAILGPHGQFIKLSGENKDDKALLRLRITDVVSAETIDMHGLLDGVIKRVEQDEGINRDDVDLQVNQTYTLFSMPAVFTVSVSVLGNELASVDLRINCNSVTVSTIEVAIGPGNMLGAAVPAVKLTVAVSGAIKIMFGGLTLAEAKVRGGSLAVEVGIKLSPDGTPQIVAAVSDSAFDIDLKAEAIAALLATFPVLAPILAQRVESKEREINDAVVAVVKNLFSDPTLAPRILMTIFGAHLTYLPIRFEGEDIVFDHIAPVEPDPKPTPGYQGAIGRSVNQFEVGGVTFRPPLLGDTWRADNLSKKIKHVVVVMMENRSYDHVLGYRTLAPFGDDADGLTDELISKVNAAPNGPFKMQRLREAGFAANSAGLKTRLPKFPGHDLHDVEQQLSLRTPGPANRTINSPKGFVDNFRPKLGNDPQGVVADDVLGFYDNQDLAFFAFLAEHYAYCDRYFCSHPGPTLPNRMYSLTGDLQHDRYGFPILDNNNGDNFLLSRALTIYDLLARKGIGFRVYESAPSVTMLRMFARYATDNINIVPLSQLEADVAPGGRGLPALTAIEPQMHAHPEDDDHPDADMLRGQKFLKRVYDALTSNRALWENTLLIITYDEHGGFYDHVIPPVADVFTKGGLVFGSAGVAAAPPPAAITPPLLVPYGVRVPTFVVSPWVKPGKGPGVTLDHCSILKTVLTRFLGAEKPFLSDRVHVSHSFEDFLTEAVPRLNVPPSPSLPSLDIGERKAVSPTTKIITRPLSRQDMREGPVDYHELSGRWARQLGR